MRKFVVTDLQLGDIRMMTELQIRKDSFQIIKNRSEAVDDELGQKFAEIVEKGFDNFTFEQAIQIQEDWEYEVKEVIDVK